MGLAYAPHRANGDAVFCPCLQELRLLMKVPNRNSAAMLEVTAQDAEDLLPF